MKKQKIYFVILMSLIVILGIFMYIKIIRINEDNGFDQIPTDDILLMLVNYENKIPETYEPLLGEYDGYKMSKYIIKDFKQMLKDAEKDGYVIEIKSSYRTYAEQKEIYDDRYESYLELGMNSEDAKFFTEKEVAVPLYSEHETGLALDLSSVGNYEDKERAWRYLKENAYKYGFINRYPEDKTDITKIKSEPWHFRYVGKKYAKKIYDSNLCLEEYLIQN